MLKLNIIKVTTAKMLFWAVDGKVTIAKSRVNGRFIKREFAQELLDNMMMLATRVVNWQAKTGGIPTSQNVDYKEFLKTILFFGVEVARPIYTLHGILTQHWYNYACQLMAFAEQQQRSH